MTGAEALQKILDSVEELKNTVKSLEESTKLIEANIKVLNNRAAGLMKDSSPTTQTSAVLPANIMQATQLRGRQVIPDSGQAAEQVIPDDSSGGVLTYKKVFGRLINSTNEPIENVLIKVFDKNNEVCATAETDAIGYWESMLRPGRYVVEYTRTGFKTANKTFDVGKNAKEVEVK
jgi:hypothetical protein